MDPNPPNHSEFQVTNSHFSTMLPCFLAHLPMFYLKNTTILDGKLVNSKSQMVLKLRNRYLQPTKHQSLSMLLGCLASDPNWPTCPWASLSMLFINQAKLKLPSLESSKVLNLPGFEVIYHDLPMPQGAPNEHRP